MVALGVGLGRRYGQGLGQGLQLAAAARLDLGDPCQHPRDVDHAPLPPVAPTIADSIPDDQGVFIGASVVGWGGAESCHSVSVGAGSPSTAERVPVGVLPASTGSRYTRPSTDVLLGRGRRSRW